MQKFLKPILRKKVFLFLKINQKVKFKKNIRLIFWTLLVLFFVQYFLSFSFFNLAAKEAKATVQEISYIHETCSGSSNYTSEIYDLGNNCFNLLSDWEAVKNENLITANKIAVAQIEGIWNTPDTSKLVIDGWETDEEHYIKIFTTPESRHNGKVSGNGYELGPNTFDSGDDYIEINEDYTIIDGLKFKGSNNLKYGRGIYLKQANGVQIKNNLIYDYGANRAYSVIDVRNGNSYVEGVKIYNNIIIQKSGTYVNDFYGIRAINAYDDINVYNNTVINFNYIGIGAGSDTESHYNAYGAKSYVKNNIAWNNGIDFSVQYIRVDSYNNFSQDDTAPGINSIHGNANGKNPQFIDTTAGGEDLHLSVNSDAKDTGVNLSTEFTNDIDVETRNDVAWDIGADEYKGEGSSPCVESWTCTSWTDWSTCVNNNQIRTRDCADQNNCSIGVNKPSEIESQSCTSTCTSNCTNKQCGNDGCGGSCGDCSGDQICNTSGQCVTQEPGILFQDNFNDHPDWSPEQSNSAINCFPGNSSCNTYGAPPEGYFAYRVGGSYMESQEDPWGHNTLNIDSTNHRGDSGKAFTFWNESIGGVPLFGSDGILAVDLGEQGHEELFVRLYIKFQPDWQWGIGQTMQKFFRISHYNKSGNPFVGFQDGSHGPVVIFDLAKYKNGTSDIAGKAAFRYENIYYPYKATPYHESGSNFYFPGGSYGGGGTDFWHNSEQFCPNGMMGDGEWHSWEIQVKANSAVGVPDGEFRFWQDGVLYNEVTDLAWSDEGAQVNPRRWWNYVALGGNNNNHYAMAEENQEQWYAIDDFVISTEYIGPDHEIDDSNCTCTNNETKICNTGLEGICATGTQTCTNEAWGACVQDNQAVTEICNDNLDNDCDGDTDGDDTDCQACVIECTNKQCGNDNCGGSCGICSSSQICNTSGQCLVQSSSTNSPVLNFSDLISGPKTGNADGAGGLTSSEHGSIITVWGVNLGETQKNSKVYFRDSQNNIHEVAHIYYWKNADGNQPSGPADLYTYQKMQEIAFSVPSSVADGPGKIFINIDEVNSNELDFTIRAGNIYHIKTTGSDSTGDGSWLNPWATISRHNSGSQGASTKVSPGDTVYVGDGVNEIDTDTGASTDSGIYISGVHAGEDNTNTQIAFVTYPGARAKAKGKNDGITLYKTSGIVISKYIAEAGEYYEVLEETGSIKSRAVGINTNKNGRLIANRITDPEGECASGWNGAIKGDATTLDKDMVSNVKIYGNYIHDWGCEGTSKFEHTTYLSVRNGGAFDVDPWEFGWNLLKDNMAVHGIHNYDETNGDVCGDIKGTVRIHDNYIINQTGAAIDISAKSNSGICWTAPFEVYNNVLVNTGLGPVNESGALTSAIYIRDKGLSSHIKIFNNTIYGYGDPEIPANERGGNAALYVYDDGRSDPNPTIEFSNNIIYDTKGVAYTNIEGDIALAHLSGSNNVWYSDHGISPDLPASLAASAILSDPLFINKLNNNLNLQETSPAKDAGLDLSIYFSDDFFGVFRPQGSAYDIGAYEYSNTNISSTGNSTDTTPPQGNISINSGEEITNSDQTVLNIFATDISGVTEMKISDQNNFTGPIIRTYNTALDWILSGIDGLKTVYVWFKDSLGNWTNNGGETNITSSITLDTTSPTILNIATSGIGKTTTTISWKTSENTIAELGYGFSSNYGQNINLGANYTNTHTVDLSNLSGNTNYHYRVKVTDKAGNITHSIDKEFNTKLLVDIVDPGAITNLANSNITESSVTLIWTASGDDNANGVAESYDVRYSTSEINASNWDSAQEATGEPIPKESGQTNNYQLVGLSAGTNYYIVIKVVDEAGNISDISNVLSVQTTASQSSTDQHGSTSGGGGGSRASAVSTSKDKTPPQKVDNFKVTPADKQIYLSWTNPTDSDFVRVVIVRKENSSPSSKSDGEIIYEGNKEEYTDVNLSNSKKYHYAVFSYDENANYSAPEIATINPQANRRTIEIENRKLLKRKYAYLIHLGGLKSKTVNEASLEEATDVVANNNFVTLDENGKRVYDEILKRKRKGEVLIEDNKFSIAHFIHVGSPTTKRLGSGERAGVINSYISAFDRVPKTKEEWQDVVKLANGRWPNEKSETAEARAKELFKKVYLRNPNMENPNDNAAVSVVAYGLRPANRNMNSEKTAIKTFKYIYGYNPNSSIDWDVMRAISYSGAVR